MVLKDTYNSTNSPVMAKSRSYFNNIAFAVCDTQCGKNHENKRNFFRLCICGI